MAFNGPAVAALSIVPISEAVADLTITEAVIQWSHQDSGGGMTDPIQCDQASGLSCALNASVVDGEAHIDASFEDPNQSGGGSRRELYEIIVSGDVVGPLNVGNSIEVDYGFIADYIGGQVNLERFTVELFAGNDAITASLDPFTLESGLFYEGTLSSPPLAGDHPKATWELRLSFGWPNGEAPAPYFVEIPADSIQVRVLNSCPADLDGDGDVDSDDFFAYLDGFAGGNLGVCDIDIDGDCDADDFFAYLDLFVVGC